MSEPAVKKFCKDCKWCSGPYGYLNRLIDGPTKDPYRHSQCLHPDLQSSDNDFDYPISGFKKPDSPNFCAVVRINPCGPVGKLWEPRK